MARVVDLASLQQQFPLEVWLARLPDKMLLGWWRAILSAPPEGARVGSDSDTAARLEAEGCRPAPKILKSAQKAGGRFLLIVTAGGPVFLSAGESAPNKQHPAPVFWTFSPDPIRAWIENSGIKDAGEVSEKKNPDTRFDFWALNLLVRQAEPACAEIELLRSELAELHEKVLHIQKMENIGLLARNVGHDLNNIMSPISGYAQFLKADLPADSPLLRYAEMIEKAALMSEALVQQLTRFTPLDRIQIVSVDVHSLIDESLSLAAKQLVARRLRVEKKIPPQPRILELIPDQLLEAFVLSLLNAIEASPPGSVIEISAREVAVDEKFKARQPKAVRDAYYEISFRDRGLGMSADVLAKVYEPFFSTKPRGPGVGLGIPITDGIVRYHRGFTEITSEPGRGTEFRIYLPVPAASAPQKKTTLRPARPTAVLKPEQTLRVLLVDDDQQAQEIIAALLERQNCKVTVAASGEEALKILKVDQDGFDLILLDIVMPGMGGYETFLKLLELDVKAPVVLSTGYAKDWHVTEMLRLGAIGVLRKPYTLDELGAVLELVRPPQKISLK